MPESDELVRRSTFARPGGALRAAARGNLRSLPCPTRKRPDQLTPADAARSYQCDGCAGAEEE